MSEVNCPTCGRPMAQQRLYCAKHDKVYEPDSTCDLCEIENMATAPVQKKAAIRKKE